LFTGLTAMRHLLTLCSTLILCACGGGGGDAGDASVAFTEVSRSSTSGITVLETPVVRNTSDWAALWARHAAVFTPAPTQPSVDFSSGQVVGVFLGTRPNSCYSVEVLRVTQSATRRLVTYRETTPSATATCTAQAVAPMHLVRISASTLPVEFQSQ
jgi:hypothetical protein